MNVKRLGNGGLVANTISKHKNKILLWTCTPREATAAGMCDGMERPLPEQLSFPRTFPAMGGLGLKKMVHRIQATSAINKCSDVQQR